MIIQTKNKPTIDDIAGAVVYSVCRRKQYIYCDNASFSRPLEEIIKDYSLPLGVKVVNNLNDIPRDEFDAVALIGLDIADWDAYTAIRNAGTYFFLHHGKGNSIANPPSLRIETQSVCSLTYEIAYKKVEANLNDKSKRLLVDLLYLGICQATDRFQLSLTERTLKHKKELEALGANVQVSSRYLRYTLSQRDMLQILRDTSETAICGANDNIAIVSVTSSEDSAMRVAVDLLEALDTIDTIVVCSKLSDYDGTYSVLVKSMNKFFTADNIIEHISSTPITAKANVYSMASKCLYMPSLSDVSEFVNYIKSLLDTLSSNCQLLDNTLPNTVMRIGKRKNYSVRILDIMQLSNLPMPRVTVAYDNGSEITTGSRYWEMRPDGNLYPITEEQLNTIYKKSVAGAFGIGDIVCLQTSYTKVIKLNGLNTYVDSELINQIRVYDTNHVSLPDVKVYPLTTHTRILVGNEYLVQGSEGDFLVVDECGIFSVFTEIQFEQMFQLF